MIVENWAQWLAMSFASSRYNPRGDNSIEGLQFPKRQPEFQSQKLINFKEMLFLKKQKMLQNLESSYSKVGW